MTVEDFNSCVDLYSDGIYRFALKMLGDTMLAEDNVQDSFERLWVKRGEIDRSKAKSYLFTTSYHASVDAIRRDRHKQELENAQPVLEIGYQPNFDVKEIINHAVDQLPTVQKSVLLLRDYEGYSYSEIAGITGLNESQVKVYIYRARVFLKEKLVSIENLI